jgi:hypothetical protein
VPRDRLPRLPDGLAATVRPVTVGGHAIVGTAWVDYEPGGVLSYRELLSAVLVHERNRPHVTIVDIWVDSPASRDGGRELWGIPKELADLEIGSPAAGMVRAAAGGIAEARISLGRPLPGRWPTRLSVAQWLRGRVEVTPVRGRAGIRLATATWRVAPDGPLAYLSGRRPWLTVALRDFRMVFGEPEARA